MNMKIPDGILENFRTGIQKDDVGKSEITEPEQKVDEVNQGLILDQPNEQKVELTFEEKLKEIIYSYKKVDEKISEVKKLETFQSLFKNHKEANEKISELKINEELIKIKVKKEHSESYKLFQRLDKINSNDLSAFDLLGGDNQIIEENTLEILNRLVEIIRDGITRRNKAKEERLNTDVIGEINANIKATEALLEEQIEENNVREKIREWIKKEEDSLYSDEQNVKLEKIDSDIKILENEINIIEDNQLYISGLENRENNKKIVEGKKKEQPKEVQLQKKSEEENVKNKEFKKIDTLEEIKKQVFLHFDLIFNVANEIYDNLSKNEIVMNLFKENEIKKFSDFKEFLFKERIKQKQEENKQREKNGGAWKHKESTVFVAMHEILKQFEKKIFKGKKQEFYDSVKFFQEGNKEEINRITGILNEKKVILSNIKNKNEKQIKDLDSIDELVDILSSESRNENILRMTGIIRQIVSNPYK
ncbi:MAG: hypothetical protein AAB526_02520 [Patescibacteria group bacterium]